MTKTRKKICSLLLGLVMAVALVFGIVFAMPTKIAKAETTVDFSDSVLVSTKAQYGDYADAYMIRVQFEANGNYWGQSKCLNDSYPDLLKYLTLNGKSFYDLRAEYATALANGTATEITWTGYPNNEKVDGKYPMQPNIADDLTRETPRALYAPIFAMLTYHTSLSANCIDIYIPGTYLDPSAIETFGISQGFSWTAEDGTNYTVSDDVTFYGLGYGNAYKHIGELNFTETETTITKIDPNASNTNFMLFYLSENNYDGTSHATGNLQKLGLEQLSKLNLWSYIEVDGQTMSSIFRTSNISEIYYQVWSKADSFAFRVTSLASDGSDAISKVRIKAGAQFPKYDSTSSTLVSATECYTVKREMIFVNNNGVWEEEVKEIETNVTDAKLVFDSETDSFAAIALEGSDYESAPATYAGEAVTALSYAQSENFLSHILMDDVALAKPGEAFLNVWRNYGYFTFRPNNVNVSKITILAGCKFPTYNALSTGASEVYVTTEDVTFVKGSDGTWVEGSMAAGEYDTSISSVVYARDNANNWMMFTLTDKDYPNAATNYNLATTEEKISALNLYDKIVVDGYTLRSRMSTYGNPVEAPKINLWVADCFAIRIAGASGALDGAKKVTIKAGAQFPSYAYITEGVEAYYVTTEEITFVNVGASNGAWERQYTATFVADGVTVETISYTVSQGLTAPEVPEKDGYRGEWESYTLGDDIIVEAVYTERNFEYATTSVSTFKWDGDGKSYVTFYLTNGENVAQMYGNNTSYDLSIYNLWDEILVTTKNGSVYTLGEVYAGDGGDSWYISFGNRPSFLLKLASDYRLEASDPIIEIYIPSGTEFPSYDNYGTKAYVTTVDSTFKYSETSEWTYVFNSASIQLPTDFDDNYILSDLYNIGYVKTAGFQDGIETLTYTDGGEADYRYGYIGSTSFTLSFDFKFTGASYYDTFNINLGTEGYGGNKYHFGWRFYLLRGDASATVPNFCVEYFSNTKETIYYTADGESKGNNIEAITFGSTSFEEEETYHVIIGYKLVDAATGEVQVYTAINQYSQTNTYTLGGGLITFGPYIDSITMSNLSSSTVTVSDPERDMDATAFKLILDDGAAIPNEIMATSYVLPALNPAEYNMAGNVFVGWTTDASTLEDLYPAGHELTLTADTTLYPVWLGFKMQDGAAVRKADPSGIRFLVDVNANGYKVGVEKGLITEIGTILAPTSYLTNRELTHELGAGYYVEVATSVWNDDDTYSAAFTNLSVDQYTRSFSARGYMKIAYTSGEVEYIYTAYDENNNARNIYSVATAAKKAGEALAQDVDYINSVADITVNGGLTANKTDGSLGDYTVTSGLDGSTITITVDKGVKAALINGTRVIMGYDAQITIDNAIYDLSGYKLTSDGLQIQFTVTTEQDDSATKAYYLALLKSYLNSEAYTDLHKERIVGIVEDALADIENVDGDTMTWADFYSDYIASLEIIKTAAELAENNTSTETLDTPVLLRGLGYTVTWNAVKNAGYYYVYDDNDYRNYTVVMKNGDNPLSYEAEVVGNHNIKVVAHSYYEAFNSSEPSNTVSTPEVKPVFSYKSMSDGLYKFTSSQMSTMGITITDDFYYDSSDGMYFAYYNKDTGWSPNGANATDWTSPAEFPAHAQRLKDMGNNIIMIAYDSNGSYKAGETWEASRMRYIMDTAWSMGMKVLVCDEVFYDLSMSDSEHKDTCAQNKEQVTTAINSRDGFAEYVTHPAFYGFSLDDEPYGKYISAMSYTISALDDACEALGVSDPFYLACLFQYQGGTFSLDGSTEWYSSKSSLVEYYNKWLAIEGVDNKYLYVDIYTQHAMGQPTNRYNDSFDAVYGDSYLGGKYDFYQAITAHTQNSGTLLEQDLYMSLLYAAAHDVAGYSWFCYFPISGETSGSMVGFDGNGLGNGKGNNASGSYYNAAKTAGYQFELIQGLLDGYDWQTRSVDGDLLTTTLSNGTNTATMYVNADLADMSASVTVTASGSQCYLVGYGVGTADAPYEAVSGSVTLAPGQAVICIS